jgi:prophage tail gpP-like protein
VYNLSKHNQSEINGITVLQLMNPLEDQDYGVEVETQVSDARNVDLTVLGSTVVTVHENCCTSRSLPAHIENQVGVSKLSCSD